MKVLPPIAALAFGLLAGCAAAEPEVEVLGTAPSPISPSQQAATSPASHPDGDPVGRVIEGAYDREKPGMTEVLEERGIPDRVANEGESTLWIYETSAGEEVFIFGKEGKFISYEERATSPGS